MPTHRRTILDYAIAAGRRWLWPQWLTGPIFAKELCVAGRRRRNYVLRSVYVVGLALVMALLWAGEMHSGGPATVAYRLSRMAMVGKLTIMFTVWFQFIATQVVAVVGLSGAVSDEVYHRTLAALATTPVTGLQIVMGKLLSRLLQLVLLLAISLPLLAVARVFGGVPWDYVLWSLGITLSTAVFAGSLAIFVSIFTRRAYVAIIATVLILGGLFLLLPLLTGMILVDDVIDDDVFISLLTAFNPYVAMGMKTNWMMLPRGMAAGGPAVFGVINCTVMLVGSALLVMLSAFLVRRLALRLAAGQTGRWAEGKPRAPSGSAAAAGKEDIRRVWDSAVLWKEFRTPLLGRHKVLKVIGLILGVFVLLLTYLLCANEHSLGYSEVQAMFAVVFFCLGMLLAIVIPATLVTSEKETDAWPLLLTTALSDGQIILGKLAGALRRCLPVWALLFGHVAIFAVGGVTHWVALVHLTILVGWLVFFLCCSGLYFSCRFRRTTVAVVMNFALAAVLWAVVPFVFFAVSEIVQGPDDLAEFVADANPFVQVVVIVETATRHMQNDGDWSYYWVSGSSHSTVAATVFLILCTVLYTWVALVFLWRAKVLIRRRAV